MPKSVRVLTLKDGRVYPVVRGRFVRSLFLKPFRKGASAKKWSWA